MTEAQRLPIDPESVKFIHDGLSAIAKGRDSEAGNVFSWSRPVKDLNQGREFCDRNPNTVVGPGLMYGNSAERLRFASNILGGWKRLTDQEIISLMEKEEFYVEE